MRYQIERKVQPVVNASHISNKILPRQVLDSYKILKILMINSIFVFYEQIIKIFILNMNLA